MSTSFRIVAANPASAANKPHVLGRGAASVSADDPVLEVRNGPAAADAVLLVDKDGDLSAGASRATLTRVVRLLEGRDAVRLGNWVVEYNEADDALDFLHEPE
jgi:hypothetical protein